jgi:hypothetical protein
LKAIFFKLRLVIVYTSLAIISLSNMGCDRRAQETVLEEGHGTENKSFGDNFSISKSESKNKQSFHDWKKIPIGVEKALEERIEFSDDLKAKELYRQDLDPPYYYSVLAYMQSTRAGAKIIRYSCDGKYVCEGLVALDCIKGGVRVKQFKAETLGEPDIPRIISTVIINFCNSGK